MPDAPARVLGPFSTTAVVIGAIIGVGIFFTPARVAGLTGSPSLLILSWAIGGLIALCGALTLAELGGMYTGSAAQYQILRDSCGRLPAFLFVFCNATAIQAGVIGIIAIICAQNLAVAVGRQAPEGAVLIGISLALILSVTAANAIGTRAGAAVQNFTVVAKLLTLVAIAAVAFLASPAATDGLSAGAASSNALSPFKAVAAALIPVFFAYGGWQHALWISGEVKNPARNLPRAIIVGVVIVIAVYLLANVAYLRLLGIGGMAASKTLAADAVAVVIPKAARQIIAGAVALSAFGVLNAQFLSGPRLIYGLAAAGQFFRPFGRIHPRLGTPVAAILLLSGMGIVLLLSAAAYAGITEGSTAQDTLDLLLTGAVAVDLVFFALTAAALVILRVKMPGTPRPVRVPLYPIVPLIFIAGLLLALVGSLLDEKVRAAAFIGGGWIVLAVIVYFVFFSASDGQDGASGESPCGPAQP